MSEEFKNIVTLPLTREPGGKERSYTFEPSTVIYVQRKYYSSIKKSLSRIQFDKGFGLPDVCYSPLSIDDLMEIFNASGVIGVEYPSRYIRIPLKNHRNEKFEEKILDISTVKGIQLIAVGNGDTDLLKLHLKDNNGRETVLYTNLSGHEWDRAIEKSSTTIN